MYETYSLVQLVRNPPPAFNDEFYRRVAWINKKDRYVRPQNAQEKFIAVRDAMKELEPTRMVVGSDLAEYDILKQEYDKLYPLVSFDFPDS